MSRIGHSRRIIFFVMYGVRQAALLAATGGQEPVLRYCYIGSYRQSSNYITWLCSTSVVCRYGAAVYSITASLLWDYSIRSGIWMALALQSEEMLAPQQFQDRVPRMWCAVVRVNKT